MNEIQNQHTSEDEIDLIELLKKVYLEKKFILKTFDLNCLERPALNPSSEAFDQGIRKASLSLKAFLINFSGFSSKSVLDGLTP